MEILDRGVERIEAELVTLSACETGLGDVVSGEGVFGLRRALVTAGSESQLISLWKVDDAATMELMTLFYDNLWRKGMGKLDALRQAQLSILNASNSASIARGPGGRNP